MKRRVLVVDDDPQILEVVELRLASMGVEAAVTVDPARALELAAATRFDAALLDLRIEPTDGILLMEAIHGHQPRLPVLIMTGHATVETAVEAIQRGAFDYLTKPFVPDELRRKVSRALSLHRWARDRERLLTVGEILASSGRMERVLDAVATAAVEALAADRCVVFQLVEGRFTAMARAGPAPPDWAPLEGAASLAMDKGAPTIAAGPEDRLLVAAPLIAPRGPSGALVIDTAGMVHPSGEDLDLLALFSAQAAVAIRNTHELERLRSGALAALGRLATQVAHELRNPLAGILLYARHLEHRLARAGDADGAETARKIGAAVERLGAVVGEITAFGRPTELNRERTALAPLLDECLTFARARCASEGIDVRQGWDPACPEVLADARELRKAFLNLILNGLEALDGRGTLTLATAHDAGEGAVTVTVEDTGPGMTEETRARVFDMFFTTKPQGTGLGMAIARSVVSRHGGTLVIESAPGRGTRVAVRLPVDGRFPERPGGGP